MNRAREFGACAVAAAMTLLLADRALGQTAGPAGKPVPKLVLFMVIDGFPQEQFVKYYDQYGASGFRLWLDKAPGMETITTAMPPPTPVSVTRPCYHARILTNTA